MTNQIDARFVQFGRLVPLAIFLLVWQLSCQHNEERRFLFSTPMAVAAQIARDLTTDVLLSHLGITFAEALTGFLAATLLGSVVGLLLASFSSIERLAEPYVRVLGIVPLYAIAPMTILWFGTGFTQKAAIAFLSCVFVATGQAFRGASEPSPSTLLLFQTLHADPVQLLWKLRLPSAIAWVASGCRLNVGFALLGAFLGEIISSDAGLGHYIMRATGLYDVARVLSGLACVLFLGLLMDRLVTSAFRICLPWARIDGASAASDDS